MLSEDCENPIVLGTCGLLGVRVSGRCCSACHTWRGTGRFNYTDFGSFITRSIHSRARLWRLSGHKRHPGKYICHAGVTTAEMGSIQSLNSSGPIPAFMTFATGGSSLQLNVTTIPAGSVGPFTLTDTAQGLLATFQVDGYIGSNPALNPFEGDFTIGLAGLTSTNFLPTCRRMGLSAQAS